MQFTYVAVAAALATVASAWGTTGSPSYVTETVTDTTIYCPYATTVAVGSSTYVVTEATTLTVSGTFTITKPAYVTPAPYTAPAPYTNGTASTGVSPVTVPVASGTGSSPAAVSTYATGAANKQVLSAGAALGGVLAFAAFVL